MNTSKIKVLLPLLAVGALGVTAAVAHEGFHRPSAASIASAMAKDLGLDQKATQRLADALTKRDQAVSGIESDVADERATLAELVEGGAPDAEITKQIGALRNALAKLPAPDAIIDDTRGILTPMQQAKLLLRGPRFRGPPPDFDGPPPIDFAPPTR